jgi:uncharacterized protein (UPF0371 family)
MPNKKGFDNEKYLQEQTAAIQERVGHFNNKLYLEFGGKLIYDYHAARVLPGFDPQRQDTPSPEAERELRGHPLHLRR